MADREVTQTLKSEKGDIIALCNSRAIWSPKLKSMAILEIEENIHRYFVNVGDDEIEIHVIYDPYKGKYLRTDPDKSTSNNLENLPDH